MEVFTYEVTIMPPAAPSLMFRVRSSGQFARFPLTNSNIRLEFYDDLGGGKVSVRREVDIPPTFSYMVERV